MRPEDSEMDLARDFVNATSDVPEPDVSQEDGPGSVPFVSALKLNLMQETRLIEAAFARKETLERQLGRDIVKHNDWISGGSTLAGDVLSSKTHRTFMGKRELFERTFRNDVEWRATIFGGEEDNIFAVSNLTAPISRRIVRQMVSRANNYFFGTDPWLACYPVGSADVELADKLDKYSKYKLAESLTKHTFEQAVELAFIRGEAVLKITHERNEEFYKTFAEVLIDPQTDQPMIAQDGDYILRDDLWVAPAATENPESVTTTGPLVLQRDGQTLQPETQTYRVELINRRKIIYEGPRIDIVFFKDFLAPLDAPSLQEADCLIHLFDRKVSDMVDEFMRRANDNNRPSIERLISVIRDLASETSGPKAARNQSTDGLADGTNHLAATEENNISPVAEIAEFYIRFDADGDGIQEDIFLVCDVSSRRPIYYDYVANINPSGTRPFDVVRINPIDGRWWGLGGMEMFETYQEVVDLLLNRWNVSQTDAGRVTTFNPEACYEGDEDPDLHLNRGDTYTLKPGKTIKDLVDSMVLIDVKFDALQSQMEFFLQMVMNESGVQHANDAQMVGLDQAKLATGIRNIEKAGQEMFSSYLSHCEPGLKGSLQKWLKVLFSRMDRKETFEFFEGKVGMLLEVSPEEVQNLNMNVDLQMTRYRGEQQLASNLQAAQHVQTFYSLPPIIQMRVAPFYIQILKSLQIQDAEEIIHPLPMDPSMPGALPAPSAQGALPEGNGQSPPNL